MNALIPIAAAAAILLASRKSGANGRAGDAKATELLGHLFATTGNVSWDPNLHSAKELITEFQLVMGIPVTGTLDDETQHALEEHLASIA